ncbi:hypothetical protein DL769_003664 [Monosporascus sp. CRB-8-3]|nr:hypothetical protein DL769_003664 [Monosporascus sp. CRB-8-3]
MTEPSTEATREKSAEPLHTSGGTPGPDATTGSPAAAAAATTSNVAQDSEEPAGDILPASHWQAQEEPEGDDIDSAYEADNASSTASLTASILEYRTLHGRTYHSERGNAQSWNPNDAQHEESMDLLHHVSTLLLDGKLFLAPIDDNVQKVLDVGCGTGKVHADYPSSEELLMFPISRNMGDVTSSPSSVKSGLLIRSSDFADQYPGAEVIGVDISPQQAHWLPPNLKFEVDDVTQEWTYAPDSFDYVHIRWLVGAIPDWNELFKQAYKTLKPGGYLESKESSGLIRSDDGTVPVGSALDQWGRVFWEAGKKFGRSFRVFEDELQRKAMEAAGFVDIKEYIYKASAGPLSLLHPQMPP